MDKPQVMSIGGCTFGCDPEFFFHKEGKIIGAERVIPKEGLTIVDYPSFKGLVLDGVQVELHTRAGTCRQGQGSYLVSAMTVLKNHLKNHEGVEPVFDGVVTVPRRELDQLSEQAKVLGCAPSFNYYNNKATVGVKNPHTYTKRSAGGHIHLGDLPGNMKAKDASQPHGITCERLVPLLDILLGNTCVLLDRDPNAAARRRYYGRAGEYRLPKHGLEYRTLSNFWLHSYPLMSFVMAVARQAVFVLETALCCEKLKPAERSTPYCGKYFDAERALLGCVHLPTVVKAINTNSLELAWKNWESVREFVTKYVPSHSNGLSPENLDKFEFFAKKIQDKGLKYWWPKDPMVNWTNSNGLGHGWESFIIHKVRTEKNEETREVTT